MKADLRTIAPQDRWRARKFAGSYVRLLTGERAPPAKPKTTKTKPKPSKKPRQGVLPLANDGRKRP